MPDAGGAFKGQGWSRKREAGWERVFGCRYPKCIKPTPNGGCACNRPDECSAAVDKHYADGG